MPDAPAPPPLDSRWQPALAHSRYLRRLLDAQPGLAAELAPLWEHPLTRKDMSAWLREHASGDDDVLRRALRQLRQRVMARLILRDLCGDAPLAEIVEGMTLLADLTVNWALDAIHADLAAKHGEPLTTYGQPQRLLVVGMGKLGGRELNVSSDIDLIFVYPEDGQTAGERTLSAHDFFLRVGKRLIAVLADLTADGQVFRVDMRLRPNGDSGPLVLPLDALENYFITQGREWERYAWIKARLLNHQETALHADDLAQLARHFVFRKYLDFGAINAMRDLHAQIRREVAKKDMADHVKLGPGGIREIEFIAQVFQLIRGGREPALQIRPTLKVLDALVEHGQLDAASRDELARAYDFLRRTEHRLQYVEDAQTHRLPGSDADRAQLARSMGFADYLAFLAALDTHRAAVSRQFEAVFSEPEHEHCGEVGLWQEQLDADVATARLAELGFQTPDAALAQLAAFRAGGRYQQLPTSSRTRLDAVGPRLFDVAARTGAPDLTLTRLLDFLDTICRRGAYLALLQQYPQALTRVASIVGASAWAADYLNRHPIVLDELLDPRLMDIATDWTRFRGELARRLGEAAGDDEREMDILREMHHAQVFRLLAQDLAGLHTIERISDHLTELADIVVGAVLTLCWGKLRVRHRDDAPAFAVLGYGKLGGKELGYASDLDLVFVYDDEHPDAGQIYARLAQRITTWLSSQTVAGALFETDLRLRPNGDAGLLASSIDSLRDYLEQHAWPWEHQALTRARFCAGDAAVGARFEALRRDILRQPRDAATLRADVLAMRQKMFDAHGSRDRERFDLKHDRGGIVDVEFIVQYLILAHAHAHPALCDNLGNIALLRRAAELGLIDADAARRAGDAYRMYRSLQHELRLNGQHPARTPPAPVQTHIDAVRALWDAVFDGH